MLDDLTPDIISEFRGLYRRGEYESCPKKFTPFSRNWLFKDKGIEMRPGTNILFSKANIVRIHAIAPSRYLILTVSAGTGNIYDTDNLTPAVLTLAGMNDFRVLAANGRFYISPMSSVHLGLASQFVYVYDGTPTNPARKAAGAKPATAIVAATSATAGNVDIGQHLFAIAYETNTGFITPPNAVWTSYVAPGSKKVTISSIPNPGGIYTRVHILGTKKITGYSGNQLDYELFFITSVVMGTTSADINFYDTSLVSSADYLNDVLEEIPAGTDLTGYRGRLVISGVPLTGATLAQCSTSLPLVSVSGNYEQFSSVDGFLIVDPSDVPALGCKKALPYRGSLYSYKRNRTYATVDNGSEPNTWEVVQTDAAHGTHAYGTAVVIDSTGNTDDIILVANPAGVFVYNGTFNSRPLTWNIEDLWVGIASDLNYIQVVMDPFSKSIFIQFAGLFGDDPGSKLMHVLYGDYSEGLTPDKIKWDIWDFNVDNISISLRLNATSTAADLVFSDTANIYSTDYNTLADNTVAITSRWNSYFADLSGDGGINQWDAIRFKVGSQLLLVPPSPATVVNLSYLIFTATNNALTPSPIALPNITLPWPVTKEQMMPVNIVDSKVSFRISITSDKDKQKLTRVTLYGTKYADEDPS